MGEEKLLEITACEITVEVKDASTGKIYRRELPVDYYENAHFLKLSGENFDGSTSTLVFFTAQGVEKAKDIMGLGADEDNCGAHKK